MNISTTPMRILAMPFAAACLFLLHCGSDTFDAAKDCQQVCANYENCVDSDFDVSGCADRCRERADNDSAFDTKVSQCESCIDSNEACAASEAQCASECAGVTAL